MTSVVNASDTSNPLILTLPYELLYHILSFLDGHSLARFSSTCRGVHEAMQGEDRIWHQLLFPLHVQDPTPYPRFREMYRALHRHLYLLGQIWHSDRAFTGRVLVPRYTPTNGTIDLYQLLASKQITLQNPLPPQGTLDSDLLVPGFAPFVTLHMEPLISLGPESLPRDDGEIHGRQTGHGMSSPHIFLVPVKALPPDAILPSMSVWPPVIIPAHERTRNVSLDGFRGQSHRPRTGGETSQSLFRLRRETAIENSLRTRVGLAERFLPSLHESELVETYSAVDEALYSPDKAHPYRGIWCGDYGSHGVEIILFHQPHEHRLEAIKLVGDINVPRGEYAFIACLNKQFDEDLKWPGHKVYEAEGQIATHQFRHSCFIECYFIDVSSDEVAISWPALAHVSRFRRLDMNKFTYGSGI